VLPLSPDTPGSTEPATPAGHGPGAGRAFLMCPPTYFAVRYSINPWMRPDEPVDVDLAVSQWRTLVSTLRGLGHDITLITPQAELPDMVFAANGGIAIGNRAMTPRFRHPERSGEAARFGQAFTDLGFRSVRQARHVNEGEGDFLFTGSLILADSGFRSEPDAAEEVADYFGLPVLGLTLADPRLYHLDTALAVLDETTLAYWPGAFAPASQTVLRERWPDAVLVGETDAATLGLNMVSDGRNVITASGCPTLGRQLTERGFVVHPVDTSELRKSGGGAKCCVLQLHPRPGETLESQVASPPGR
jgi:N-dimethylarginine dimethylaminohydrolase